MLEDSELRIGICRSSPHDEYYRIIVAAKLTKGKRIHSFGVGYVHFGICSGMNDWYNK